MLHQEIVVIGCGNAFAGDDAVGIALVEALRKTAPKKLSLRFMQDLGPGFLCQIDDAASMVIIVDAVKSGAPVGTVHFLRLPSKCLLARNAHDISTHSLGLEQEIELALCYGGCPRLFLLGIEIGDHCIGEDLSPEVNATIERVVADFDRICGWARSDSSCQSHTRDES